MKELFIAVHRSHLVIFIFLQGKLCVLAPVSKSLAWTVFPCDKKIWWMCLLHEDGIVEVCVPGSI